MQLQEKPNDSLLEGANFSSASLQWMMRPADERFLSLLDMRDHFDHIRNHSRDAVVNTRGVSLVPSVVGGQQSVGIVGGTGVAFEPTNWSFGQICQLAGASAPGVKDYLRTLPPELVADNLNVGLKRRDVEDVKLLLYKDGEEHTLRAANGPNYGRVWNAEFVRFMIDRFGDGINGEWKIPGEFGKAIVVDKQNTTLYASDRDFFVFLADEERRIEVGGRNLARGFFAWNSEVGGKSYGIAAFLFDYACKNRIVWGGQFLGQLVGRHTSKAPERFVEAVQPVLTAYANGSAAPVMEALAAAQKARIETDVTEYMANRFGKRIGAAMQEIHVREEGRPIETLWDAATGATAYARSIPHQDARIDMETLAGQLIDEASK